MHTWFMAFVFCNTSRIHSCSICQYVFVFVLIYVRRVAPPSQYVNPAKTLPCLSLPPLFSSISSSCLRQVYILPFLPSVSSLCRSNFGSWECFYFVAFCSVWSRAWITPLLHRFGGGGGGPVRRAGRKWWDTEYENWRRNTNCEILVPLTFAMVQRVPGALVTASTEVCRRNTDNQLLEVFKAGLSWLWRCLISWDFQFDPFDNLIWESLD